MNSDKSDGANEKSRAIDIARGNGESTAGVDGGCVSKRVDEGWTAMWTAKRGRWTDQWRT